MLAVLAGLLVALVGALTGIAVHEQFDSVSPHVVAVLFGAIAANVGLVRPWMRAGLRWSARHVLRTGIVLVGVRLSLGDIARLGPRALFAVSLVVVATFFGTQWLGRRLRVGRGLSMLVAVGFSICGASAIVAAEPFADATEEEVAYAIALVTLCGSLAIAILPPVGSLLGLSSADFGSWVGASVHDVGQVVATASLRDTKALESGVVVKLTRVALLAPLLTGVAIAARQRAARDPATTAADTAERPPALPAFVVLFLVAVAVRSTGVIPDVWVARVKDVETLLLGMGLVGLGAGVSLARLRRVGGRPLALGLFSWVLVAAVALAGVGLAF